MKTATKLFLAAALVVLTYGAQAHVIKPPKGDETLVPDGKGQGQRAEPGTPTKPLGPNEDLKPTGKGRGEHAPPGKSNPQRKKTPTAAGIFYHGGPVLVGT